MTTWSVGATARFLPFVVLVATFDRAVVAPMLLTMGQDFDVDLATITVSVSAYLLAYGLAQPAWGLISDRLGRITTLRLALLLAGVMDLVSVLPMDITAFIAVRGLAGATMAGAFPTTVIFLGDTIQDARKRQSAIASLQTGVALGLSLGTILGGIGAVLIGWQAFFVATALICFGMVLALRNAINPRPGDARLSAAASFVTVGRNPWAWALYGLVFVEAAALLGAFNLVPAALERTGHSAAVAGLVTGTYGAAVLVTSLFVRRLTRSVTPATFLLAGGLSATLGFGLLIWSVTPATVLVSCAMQGVAWVTMHTTLQTWATTLTELARATAVSLFAGFMFLGNGFGAFMAAALLDFRGSVQLFTVATCMTAALTVLAVLAARRYAHRLG